MTKRHRQHILLQRSARVRLDVCGDCGSLPYRLRTRESAGGEFQTVRFYADRDEAMWAYQVERTKTC